MNKIFAVSLVMALMLVLSGCGGTASSAPDASGGATESASAAEAGDNAAGDSAAPVLPGSDALVMADAVAAEYGIEYTRQDNEDGYQYHFDDWDDSGISGDIWCSFDNEIISMGFLNAQGDPDVLVFVAGVEYEGAETDLAQTWALENAGTTAETDFGGVNFSTYAEEGSDTMSIQITAAGLEDYYAQS